jgi:hypothetical protein
MKDIRNELDDSLDESVTEESNESEIEGMFDKHFLYDGDSNADIAAQYAAYEDFDKLADLLKTSYRQDYPGEVDVNQPLSIKTINDTLMPDENLDVPYNSRIIKLSDDISIEGVFPDFPKVYELFTGDEGVGLTRYEHNQMCNELLAEALNEDLELRDIFSEQELETIKEGQLPEKYTWHHEPEVGYFSLVEREIHDAKRHTGGYALWGAKDDELYTESEDSPDEIRES